MLRKEDFRQEYTTFMKKLFAAGHAQRVPDENKGGKHGFFRITGCTTQEKGRYVWFSTAAQRKMECRLTAN